MSLKNFKEYIKLVQNKIINILSNQIDGLIKEEEDFKTANEKLDELFLELDLPAIIKNYCLISLLKLKKDWIFLFCKKIPLW